MSVPPGTGEAPQGTGEGGGSRPGYSPTPDETQIGQISPVAGGGWAGGGNPPAPDTTVSLGSLAPVEPETSAVRPSPADQAAIDALPAGSALLVVQRGPNAGARFLLDGERTTAGRRPDSDIFLDDVTVSRKHAEFVRRQGQFVVRDIGSLNGTYVRRERIDEAVLRDGDEVQIGKYRMVFHPSPRDAGAGAGW